MVFPFVVTVLAVTMMATLQIVERACRRLPGRFATALLGQTGRLAMALSNGPEKATAREWLVGIPDRIVCDQAWPVILPRRFRHEGWKVASFDGFVIFHQSRQGETRRLLVVRRFLPGEICVVDSETSSRDEIMSFIHAETGMDGFDGPAWRLLTELWDEGTVREFEFKTKVIM